MTGTVIHGRFGLGLRGNHETVTGGSSGGGHASFSPDLDVIHKVPFGGDKAAELAFLGGLRVATRASDGQPFRRKYPGEGA